MDTKKTPLYGEHEKLGARFVDFHGWELPVQYSGIIEEHKSVRGKAGLFDVSHMGEFLVFGEDALGFVNRIITNDIEDIEDDCCIYTPMCYENGTIVDDIIAYRHNSEHVMLVVNSSNIEKDHKWVDSKLKDFEEYYGGKVQLRDVSDNTAMMSIQGPLSQKILQKVADYDLKSMSRFTFAEDIMVGDVKALISRTGYTGEDGFEVYVNATEAVDAWDTILEAGKPLGLVPAGLGARDTLRLEASLMLYGNDIDDTTTPLEAGLGWTVRFGKENFIGRDELLREKADKVEKKLVGFEMQSKAVARNGYDIVSGEDRIGKVTSGGHSPTLGKNIGMGYVPPEYADPGTVFEVVIRDKAHKAAVVELPFYKRR